MSSSLLCGTGPSVLNVRSTVRPLSFACYGWHVALTCLRGHACACERKTERVRYTCSARSRLKSKSLETSRGAKWSRRRSGTGGVWRIAPPPVGRSDRTERHRYPGHARVTCNKQEELKEKSEEVTPTRGRESDTCFYPSFKVCPAA